MTKKEEEERITKMTEAACKNLNEAGIKNFYTFMINSNNPNDFEFGKLVDMFIMKVSAMKRDALVLSQTVLTNEVVESKIDVLKKRMKDVAYRAAVVAATSNREKGEYLEVKILKIELREYQCQLGIDKRSLERVADFLKCNSESVRDELNSKSDECLGNFREFYQKNDTVEFSLWDLLPFFGKMWKIQAYQKQCSFVLNESFKKCVHDNFNLRKIIRKRMNK
ncbi:hypothetical protein DPMN_053173 [Dreissena polymorpha]|uniref:Uncharacterized protein n=1 Tax=Dreissena polymorpha TaxID=45954 RepID=A0A9D4HRX6_DREPO|nr:hypothetical protein DPMN_053173 [Dreissena polymorpha]